MKVLLTGGTGYVGAWTARALEDAGHQVRLLVRDPAKLAVSAAALGVDVSDHVVGDVTDAASVRSALDGCDAVVHCAAMVAIGPGAAERMEAANLGGTRNVVGQAVELGVQRIVYVSSLAAVFRPGLTRLTGNLPVIGGIDDYGASKAAVEEYVRGLQAQGAPIHTTYPAMVLGPPAGDQFGEGNEGLLKGMRLRALPGNRVGWTVCDVRDLGRVHAALLDVPAPGRWAAGGIWVPLGEVVPMLTRASGRRHVHLRVPDRALRGFGRLQDRLHLGTLLTASAMEYYTRMPPSDNEPLERELGVAFRDPEATIADAVAGLRAAGKI